MTFRARTFVAVFIATSLALGVSTLLVERALRDYMRRDIEAGLISQASLVAALLAHRGDLADADAEADTLGRLSGARVTFIAADGRVLGDSEVDARADRRARESQQSRRNRGSRANRRGRGQSAQPHHHRGYAVRRRDGA